MLRTVLHLIEKYIVNTIRYSVESRDDGDTFVYHELAAGKESDDPMESRRISSPDEVTGSIVSRDLHVMITAALISLPAAAVVSIPALFIFSAAVAAIVGIPVLSASCFLSWQFLSRNSRFIVLKYGLAGGRGALFHGLCAGIAALSESDKVFSLHPVEDRTGVSGTPYRRRAVAFGVMTPPFVLTNIDIYNIRFDKTTVYFFPDFMLFRRGNKYAAAAYGPLVVDYSEKPVHEKVSVPRDARVLGRTWLHPTGSGGPDKRYKRNPRIPIVLYGMLAVSIPVIGDIRLLMSNCESGHSFSSFLGKLAGRYSERRYEEVNGKEKNARPQRDYDGATDRAHEEYYWREREKTEGHRRRREKVRGDEGGRGKPHGSEGREGKSHGERRTEVELRRIRACRILGIPPDAGKSEIKKAYRVLVKRYHPDRLFAVGRAEVEKAEEKLKEINRAYDELKRGG